METTKRIWKSPVKGIERFMPNEYAANCGTTYTAQCATDYATQSGYVFWDKNGNGMIDSNERTADWESPLGGSTGRHGGCGNRHEFTSDDPNIGYNAIVLNYHSLDNVLTTNQKNTFLNNTHQLPTSLNYPISPDGTDFKQAFVVAPQDAQHVYWIVCYDLTSVRNMS